jgi:hypothetical protein
MAHMVHGTPIEVWFMSLPPDLIRGTRPEWARSAFPGGRTSSAASEIAWGTLTRIWAKCGTRPRAVRDRRYTWTYLFGAVCPERGVGAAVVLPRSTGEPMPDVSVEAMNLHLAEIAKQVAAGAHAVLVLDKAGWHTSPKLRNPENITLLRLPAYAPELNPVENLWAFLRQDLLSHRVWDSYDAIVEACCHAWTALMSMPEQVTSITTRAWAQVKV